MKGVHILVVDDQEILLESCERALKSHRYHVTTAKSVDDAIEEMRRRYYDIVIVDLVMPQKGGINLLKFVKENFTQVQVIMITGYSSINTAVESIKLGAYDYLIKPFSPSELLFAVKNALEEKGRSLYPFLSDQQELPPQMIFDNIIGNSPRMIEIFKLVSKISATDTTVLIIGESGTGKELVARAIHRNSNRRDENFVTVDCLTLSPNLLESKLFGHVNGSITGATGNKAGFFELANNGTLFLDEIGNLSFDLQGELLRAIQERKYIPVGEKTPRETNIRLVAATSKNLKKMVLTGLFREDLFYRLYVVPIFLPPLRERREDIPPLYTHFLKIYGQRHDKPGARLSEAAMKAIMAYDWPGNIRELENTIERAVIAAATPEILLSDLPDQLRQNGQAAAPESIEDLKKLKKELKQKAVSDVERDFVVNALASNDWNVSRAAKAIGMQRTNLYRLLKRYDIHLPKGEERETEPDK